MKHIIVLSLFIISFCTHTQAQQNSFLVHPYLQDAEPTSIRIKWETEFKGESIVEWGLTAKLGNKTTGTSSKVNFGESRLHEVQLTGLERFTTYFYRVKTGKLRSDILQFKTPPFSGEAASFNLIAMSDMQIDRSQPDKFSEVVNEGILKYLEQQFDGKVPDNLALVMIPGDLVAQGSNYEQWQTDFFRPSEKLFSQVPVYPVPGNHEQNAQFFFKYFSLPENGDPAYSEHWWYKDYGNIRIIGLDSNEGYRDMRQQYEWLEQVLKDTETEEDIDFVFAQLHHPYKSELWIPGEEETTGKVVKMLEAFSDKTGKPSVHFFGHTHGYSRGQSRDHNHLWVNVASAGGSIDNWGEFEGRDYDEFTVTQDEYGFVMINVDPNPADPKISLKRISRGNVQHPKNNAVTDSITVYKLNQKPDAPVGVSPKKETVDITAITLKASAFSGGRVSSKHTASHWQVSTTPDFEKLIKDSWKQNENWYYKENRQKGDDLTDEDLSRLKPATTYYWRVRYRDQYLGWSDWSETLTFKTK
ncbi:3',5'-cyclic AMP phosphodiesterase CpdA [Leeuwenhoekiella aestuarii]|uniref:3',5'-cyclic AMP phosphodiesterase CpdA n=1 Tax=Leeuwenhoekiella aestuarii TaxID=2249426 RepID=A0A4Q0NN60_9FLAO|nr:fibronectin type III domain-containing protein [Leeuwenhoekiella aestuarii]RXG11318.1 3',5'-cyclic AMP phosphodiesterase CpdA [Leeuwenhoekiella aestuarii]RXG11856.1 3',5'-cyclic AMP phosphodiesterase CpdA [Leeuwenhoekiella aestuarii]